MARIRTFIGVDIGDEIRRRATALQHRLARSGADVKWVTPDAMHITLVFLGEIDERDIVTVCRAVAGVAKREPPFPIRIAEVGAFPTARRPKVVWGGITDGTEALRRLHAALETSLLDLKLYAKEERGYTPHLTLGRVRGEKDGNALAPELTKHKDWDGGSTLADEVLVYSSELGKEGPVYAVLARSPLGGASG
jgi:2'-5' RNA ligase